MVSEVTIRLVSTKFLEKLLNGSQEIEEHVSTWDQKYPKMAPSRGKQDIFFGQVTIRVLQTQFHDQILHHFQEIEEYKK